MLRELPPPPQLSSPLYQTLIGTYTILTLSLRLPLTRGLPASTSHIALEYLFNILEALEVKPSEDIKNVNNLLKAEPDE